MPLVTCPKCMAQLDIPAELWKQQVRCGVCQMEFVPRDQMQAEVNETELGEKADGSSLLPPPMPASSWVVQHQPMSGMAIASLVLGIVGLLACFCYGFGMFPGILAIILGILSLKKARRGEVSSGSTGVAWAGIITGIIATVLGGLVLLLMLVGILASVAESGY